MPEDPSTEQFMAMAEQFQKGWSLIVSMLSGAVKEMTDQGWSDEQARTLVMCTIMANMGFKPPQ